MNEHHTNASSKRFRRIALIGVAIALLLVGLGVFTRLQAESRLRDSTEESAVLTVVAASPSAAPANEELVLPGNVQAFAEAPIYARTSGYLKRWLVDIGGKVKKGELLAEIDSPEVDQQLDQAKADLASAEANYALAKTSSVRWQKLLESQSVSSQEADEKSGDASAKQAMVASAKANLQRLRELQGFEKVTAPFAGVVTARNTDVGALIGTGGRELFRVAASQTLRVYIQAPQGYAPLIKVGMPAQLRFSERPGREFAGKLVRTADAIDPVSRTLLVEIAVDNPNGELLAGSYAEVHLQLPSRTGLRVPVNTLLFRAEGLQVAVVDAQGHIHLKPIVLGRDLGSEVEVASGLSAADKVVLNPPDSIAQDQVVHIAPPPADKDGKGAKDSKDGKPADATPKDGAK